MRHRLATKESKTKVYDTVSFIKKAIAIHGNLYDYSNSVYNGSAKPIQIVCRKCGPFMIAQAQHHYSKQKCGCRCNGNRKYKTCDCGFEGYGRKQFPYNGNGLCAKCYKEKQNKSKKKCRQCSAIVQTNREFCSHTCLLNWRYINKWKQINYACLTCKLKVSATVYKNRQQPKFCSKKCQCIWAAKLQRTNEWWFLRSQNAKRKWKKNQSNFRMKKNEWYRCCVIQLSRDKQKATTKATAWEKRCSSAIVSLKKRFQTIVVREKTYKVRDWQECIAKQFYFLKQSPIKQGGDKWTHKCLTINGTMRRRRSLLQAKLNTQKLFYKLNQSAKLQSC